MIASVPLLDGTNYRIWAERMINVLMANGVWRVVNGDRDIPKILSPSDEGVTAAMVVTSIDQREKWLEDDFKALGLIRN